MQGVKFYKGDPIAKILIDGQHFTPAKFSIAFFLFNLIIGLLAAVLSGTLFSDAERVGFFDSWISVVVWILVTPTLLAGYYIWMSNAMAYLLTNLSQSEVVDISPNEVEQLQSIYQKPWRALIAGIIAITYGLFFLITRLTLNLKVWSTSGILPALVSTFGITFGGYMLIMIALTLVLNMWALSRVLKSKDFRLNPLHSDRCGGLGVLSSYALKTVYLAVVVGTVLGLSAYRIVSQGVIDQFIYLFMIGVPLYISWTVVSFFGPLITAHSEMVKARDALLNEIAQKFLDSYTLAQKHLSTNSDKLKQNVERLNYLKELNEITLKFPTWPFEVATFQKFVVAVAAPIVPFITSYIADIVRQWLTT